VAWLATVNNGHTLAQFLRCKLEQQACEVVFESKDLASAIPAVVMEESKDRVVFVARSIPWFGRPALVVIDRY
jgi:hypothetical protein